MPKVIEGLRESLIQRSREILLNEGYDAVTIRGVAGECGVAVGTVYNYFPSKEMLIASVMLQDWLVAQQRMRETVAGAAEPREALQGIMTALYDFRCIYRTAWSQYSAGGGIVADFSERHEQLVAFLCDTLRECASVFHLSVSPLVLRVAAEALLAHSQDAAQQPEMIALLLKLFQ